MKKPYQILPSALEDIVCTYKFIGAESPDSAEHFFNSLYELFEKLSVLPKMGKLFQTQNPKLRGVRYFPLRAFPHYLVFYRLEKEKIQILHIYHDARNIQSLFKEE